MLQQSGDAVIQELSYNGWTHDHYVSNVFVFSPSGAVMACVINLIVHSPQPGTVHYSSIEEWGSAYEKLETCFEKTGGQVVVEYGFSEGQYQFLIEFAQKET